MNPVFLDTVSSPYVPESSKKSWPTWVVFPAACCLLPVDYSLVRGTMWAVKQTEATLRSIRDRIASAMGTLEETAVDPARKENHRRLREAASELHRCADEVQNVMMRIKPRAS